MKNKLSGRHLFVAATGMLLPVLFISLFFLPGLSFFNRPEFESFNLVKNHIASNYKYTLAYLLAVESILLAIGLNHIFFNRYSGRSFRVMVGIAILSAAWYAFNRNFDTDEYEHFQSAWKILQGEVPLVDFFQHHHPLLWYQNILPILLWGESFTSLLAGRGINFIFFAGQLYLTFLLTKAVGKSDSTGVVAVLLLLTFKYYVDAAIENRPDNPMTFFFLWSLYILIRYWEKPLARFLVAGGAFFAAGFLYLQKAILLFPVLGSVLVFFIFKKKLSFRGLFLFGISFAIPVAVFLSGYLLEGQIEEYLLYNWIVNAHKQGAEYYWHYFLHTLLLNPFFLLLLLLALIHWVRHFRTMDARLKIIIVTGLALGILAALTPRPWKQYFLPVWPLLAVGVACTAERYLRRLPGYAKVFFAALLLLLSLPVYRAEVLVLSNVRSREAFQFVRDKSLPGDYVFDDQLTHGVFRRDMHFFWFSTHKDGLYSSYLEVLNTPRYQWLIKNRQDDFNFCALVAKFKPRIVIQRANSVNQLETCPSVLAAYRMEKGYFPRTYILEE